MKGRVKFEFRRLLDNLNTVLLAQYLQKSGNCLSKEDVAELQRSDPVLRDIIDRLSNDKQVDEKFVIKDKILFKLSLVYGIQVFRLCLPQNFAKEILFNLHSSKSAHLGPSNLRLKFRSNFWCKDLSDALKSVKDKCLICRLNAERKDLAVKGVTCENQNDITPGKFWLADVLYMPISSEGHRFILTLTERLSSYVCALPLKSLTVRHVCNAIEVFLAIVPPMEEIATDHGSGDFGEMFTQLLESYGIRHGGKLPHRSQAQGTVELANKLLQNQINKVCAGMGT